MPSGKTHDAITLLLAVPTFGIGLAVTNDFWLASILVVGFLFGGLMFGPDLDTVSNQYSRWGFLKVLWIPYRIFFKHRSRWSHGLLFGTFLRVVYFMGIVTCVAFLFTYFYSAYAGGELPSIWDFARVWANFRRHLDTIFGTYGAIALFAGMWVGAASHTFTDLAGTYVKTGRARV